VAIRGYEIFVSGVEDIAIAYEDPSIKRILLKWCREVRMDFYEVGDAAGWNLGKSGSGLPTLQKARQRVISWVDLSTGRPDGGKQPVTPTNYLP